MSDSLAIAIGSCLLQLKPYFKNNINSIERICNKAVEMGLNDSKYMNSSLCKYAVAKDLVDLKDISKDVMDILQSQLRILYVEAWNYGRSV